MIRYLINNSEVSEWSGCVQPGRDKIELFNMHIREKCIFLRSGSEIIFGLVAVIYTLVCWFEKEAIENFIRDKGVN